MTEYVILRAARVAPLMGTAATTGMDGWEEIGTVTARSAQSAIRERIDGAQQSSDYNGEGQYVAVPVRSWQPVTVKTETKTQLKFS